MQQLFDLMSNAIKSCLQGGTLPSVYLKRDQVWCRLERIWVDSARCLARFVHVAGVCFSLLSGGIVFAQSGAPMSVIIPFAAGGGTDILARMIVPKISEKLGVVGVTENKPGASGAIGAQFVAKAAPDGKTVLLGSISEIGVNPSLFPKLPYDVDRDFVAVTALASAPMVLVVNPASPIKTPADLVKLAKASPGKINFASAGLGSGAHMAGELFIYNTQVQLTHIPYKGTGLAMTDIIGSQKDMILFTPLPPAAGFIKAGQLRAVAVASQKRIPSFPEVPTFAETGVPGYLMDYWYGFMVPKDTPKALRDKLYEASLSVLKQPEVIDNLAQQGFVPTITTQDEFAKFVKDDIEKWAKVVKSANIKAD